ncbi:MAG: hypothetical protein NPINA01_13220 [Nitrospinaceae bacterium]|nr:MAG: hypothetical protein NPINA01_13220 [Nitrospinaceae bacterium]
MNHITTLNLPRCFKALNVSPGDKWEAVRKSYYLLAKQYHPDRHPGNFAYENKLKEITLAFKVLEKHYRCQEKNQDRDAPVRPGHPPREPVIKEKSSLFESHLLDDSKVHPMGGSLNPPRKTGGWNGWVRRLQQNLTKYERKLFLLDIQKNIRVHSQTAAHGGFVRLSKGKETFQVKIPSGSWNRMSLRIPEKGESSLFGKKRGDLLLNIQVVNAEQIHAGDNKFFYELDVPREKIKTSRVLTLDSVYGPIKFVLPRNTRDGQNFVLKSKPNKNSVHPASHVVTVHFV